MRQERERPFCTSVYRQAIFDLLAQASGAENECHPPHGPTARVPNDRPADSRERPKVFLIATFSCILAVSSGLPESPVTRGHSSIVSALHCGSACLGSLGIFS